MSNKSYKSKTITRRPIVSSIKRAYKRKLIKIYRVLKNITQFTIEDLTRIYNISRAATVLLLMEDCTLDEVISIMEGGELPDNDEDNNKLNEHDFDEINTEDIPPNITIAEFEKIIDEKLEKHEHDKNITL